MRAVGQALGVLGLLEEVADRVGVVGLHVDDAELVGQRDRLPDRRDGARRAGVDVLVDHLREVHPVDVVGAHDDHDVGPLVVHQVQGLEDRVGAAEVPVLAHPLLRRHRGDVVAEHRRHPPRLRDVPVEAVRLVLREHDDLQVAGVHDVREREVDEPVDARERHRRLGPVGRERHQPLALTAGEDDGEHVPAVSGGHARQRSRVPGSVGRGSFSNVRVDVVSKEYPPEVYGGAGVHVAELVRALRRSTGSTPGCTRSASRATRPAPRRTPTSTSSRARTAPSRPWASTWRSSPAARAPTSCTPTPGTPTSPGTSPRCCTACRT